MEKRPLPPNAHEDGIATVADQAAAMGFRLEPASFAIGDHTDIGLFMGPLASPVLAYDAKAAGKDEGAENKAIQQVITKFESLEPAKYGHGFTHVATDPYLAVCEDSVAIVSSERFKGLEGFRLTKKDPPTGENRRVNLSYFKFFHLGKGRALATYTFKERHGKQTYGPHASMALVVKLKKRGYRGWRVCICADH